MAKAVLATSGQVQLTYPKQKRERERLCWVGGCDALCVRAQLHMAALVAHGSGLVQVGSHTPLLITFGFFVPRLRLTITLGLPESRSSQL